MVLHVPNLIHDPIREVSRKRSVHVIVQLDNTVWKWLSRTQAQLHLAMARGYQRYTFADKNGDDADDKLINRVLVQEGSNDLASSHHPNILSRSRAHLLRECTDRFSDEADAG